MKVYLVGGAVRDRLLGLEPKEKDFVVINALSEDLLKLGYKPVGKFFPVFLHPKTQEEYALARKEFKEGKGHKAFSFDTSNKITLEEDLIRRDLTINAMAMDLEGNLIDPYAGKEDLKNRILRHISAAFIEDPLRVLRVARFYAKLKGFNFSIHPTTLKIIKQIVQSQELLTLSKERFWMETVKALKTTHPFEYFKILNQVGALKQLFPSLNELLFENSPSFNKVSEHLLQMPISFNSSASIVEMTINISVKITLDEQLRLAALCQHFAFLDEGEKKFKQLTQTIYLPKKIKKLVLKQIIFLNSAFEFYCIHQNNFERKILQNNRLLTFLTLTQKINLWHNNELLNQLLILTQILLYTLGYNKQFEHFKIFWLSLAEKIQNYTIPQEVLEQKNVEHKVAQIQQLQLEQIQEYLDAIQ